MGDTFPHHLPTSYETIPAEPEELRLVYTSARMLLEEAAKGTEFGEIVVIADRCPEGQLGYTFVDRALTKEQQIHVGVEVESERIHLGRRLATQTQSHKIIETQSCRFSEDGIEAAAVRGDFDEDYYGPGLTGVQPAKPYTLSNWQAGLEYLTDEIDAPKKQGFWERLIKP